MRDLRGAFPDLGVGVGLRPKHMPLFLAGPVPGVDWVEVISENFMPYEVKPEPRAALDRLMKVRAHTPVVLHGVSLSIGSATKTRDEFREALQRLKNLMSIVKPAWVSDHLCWTGAHGIQTFDLLPLPYTRETISLVAERLRFAQDTLGAAILMENVSSYVEADSNEMPEWEFVSEVVSRSGCGLLLDLNNIFVSSQNHEFDPYKYLRSLPFSHVGQIHLAGPAVSHVPGVKFVDTHDSPVRAEVWDMYDWVLKKTGPISTMIERDAQIPEWNELSAELGLIRERRRSHAV